MTSLPDELLRLAQNLVDSGGEEIDQATLRRAASTAYYALFHLLIADATLNWERPEYRSQIGRLFDHGNMRKASERILADVRAISRKKGPLTRTPTAVELELASVAEVFLLAQQARIEADYVTSEPVTYTKVASVVKDVAKAFTTWREIRLEPAAQSYLVAMLSK